MDTVILKFRTSLGGFKREDVQQYIEQTAAAHRREMEELQAKLKQSEQRREELEAALSGAETEKGSAAAEEAKVRASLETSTRTLAKLRGELSQTESKLLVAKQELERLQGQVDTLEPMATSYAQLKDRVATVELDAHRRAQDTVSEAQAAAERLQGETRAWLEGVLSQYETLRRGMDGLLAQVQLLSRDSEGLSVLDDAARGLRERGGLQ